MLFFWIFIVIAIVAFDRAMQRGVKNKVLEYQFKLYALRDELREAAIEEKINPRDWLFLYLDSSIAKTIDVLETITIWHILLAPLTVRNREKFQRARMQLKRELAKPKNHYLAKIREQYIDTLSLFVLNRHPLASGTIIKCLIAISIGQELHKQWKKGIEIQTEAPETSTLLEYAPA